MTTQSSVMGLKRISDMVQAVGGYSNVRNLESWQKKAAQVSLRGLCD